MSSQRNPAPRHRRTRRRPVRRFVVAAVLLTVLIVGGQKLAPYPGTLEQRGGTVNDVSCLNRTQVNGVVRPRRIADVREALAFAREHDLVVSIAGTQHAMGGQASYPGALVLDMHGFDAVTVDERLRTATVQAGATWHKVLETVHPVGLSVSTMPGIDVFSVGGTVSVKRPRSGLPGRQPVLDDPVDAGDARRRHRAPDQPRAET